MTHYNPHTLCKRSSKKWKLRERKKTWKQTCHMIGWGNKNCQIYISRNSNWLWIELTVRQRNEATSFLVINYKWDRLISLPVSVKFMDFSSAADELSRSYVPVYPSSHNINPRPAVSRNGIPPHLTSHVLLFTVLQFLFTIVTTTTTTTLLLFTAPQFLFLLLLLRSYSLLCSFYC